MALSKEKMVFKQMMDNIDEPLPIFTSKSNYFSVNLCARGCLVYMNTWNPVDGEILVFTQ